jgi:hypothetical protein
MPRLVSTSHKTLAGAFFFFAAVFALLHWSAQASAQARTDQLPEPTPSSPGSTDIDADAGSAPPQAAAADDERPDAANPEDSSEHSFPRQKKKKKDKEEGKKEDKKEEPARGAFRPGRGVRFATEDRRFELNIKGRLQLRDTFAYVFGEEGNVWENTLEPRRLRIALAGHCYSPDVQYKVQLGLGTVETEQPGVSPLQDGWVAFTHARDANLKVGQQIVPFDRARMISSGENQLVDRSVVINELALGRDVGIVLGSSDLFGLDWLAYSLGLFGGEGRNPGSAPLGLLYTARIQVSPFGAFDDDVESDLKQRSTPRLAIGIGAAYNTRATKARSTAGGKLEVPFDYLHGAADMMFKWGGFSMMGEVLARKATENTQTVTDDPAPVIESSRNGWGYLIQGGFMITSQLEIAGRYAELYAFARSPKPDDIREIGAGPSWYFWGHPFKMQADYVRVIDNVYGGYHHGRLQLQVTF